MENRITPENITELKPLEIFVFGSNEAGIHGAGAAKLARDEFGTKSYYGFGFSKKNTKKGWIGTFAIPTKNWDISTLDPSVINFYVSRFIEFVKRNENLKFYVTEIGCGLAGYTPEQIAPMFKEAVNLENVYLPQRFWDVLNKTK